MRERHRFQPRDRFHGSKVRERVAQQGAQKVGRRSAKGSLKRWVKEMRRLGKIR